MGKQRLNTRRHLHKVERRAREEAKVARGEESTFRYRHEAEMRKMLKGVDLDRYEALAG